ncbi:MAG TPA: DUF1987 domain-containing protein [Bacteroidales bacterium]|jgi:hypothetical protein|nr:DUF1987 domain-containing protein [Bacteroidales bacterium]OQB62530.1 MAG: hypothetical protein BWX96_01407 [Bacteroidetes bacterium ADurb.Bin145]NMD03999.1 DUF1987 domain-containing protein [Bacteroidales bacterium]HOU01254.1 DUF1987 domain-containing protein [Bacteroidales bacterium]HQG63686.1 DUF1987 domain-containing protein [Bacteroidales bacterium]
MQKLIIDPTVTTPGICFSPDNNQFYIRGVSSPEDVRSLYYPVLEWIKKFVDEILAAKHKMYNRDNPLRFQIDLAYFNSSSAKFFYDILIELKRLDSAGYSVKIEWFYDEEDSDMKEAGEDISMLVEMKFDFVPKPPQES